MRWQHHFLIPSAQGWLTSHLPCHPIFSQTYHVAAVLHWMFSFC